MKKLLASALGSLSTLAFPALAFAQEFDPCIAENEGTGTTVGGLLSTGCSDTSFGFILGQLINFIFVIAVVLSLGFLVYGGVRWITSGGDKTGVENARNMIIAAIVGLLIIVLSYFILNNLVLPFLGLSEGFQDLEVSSITGNDSTAPPPENSQ